VTAAIGATGGWPQWLAPLAAGFVDGIEGQRPRHGGGQGPTARGLPPFGRRSCPVGSTSPGRSRSKRPGHGDDRRHAGPNCRWFPSRRPYRSRRSPRRWLVVVFTLFGAAMTLMLVTAETGPPGNWRDPTQAGPARANPPVAGLPPTGRCCGRPSGSAAPRSCLLVYGRRSWRARRMDNGLAVHLRGRRDVPVRPVLQLARLLPDRPALSCTSRTGCSPGPTLAPTFEPVFFYPLYMVWLVAPALLSHAIWKRIRARRAPGSWMYRPPAPEPAARLQAGDPGHRLRRLSPRHPAPRPSSSPRRPGRSSAADTAGRPSCCGSRCSSPPHRDGHVTALSTATTSAGRSTAAPRARLRSFARFPRLTEVAVAWSIIAASYVGCLAGMATPCASPARTTSWPSPGLTPTPRSTTQTASTRAGGSAGRQARGARPTGADAARRPERASAATDLGGENLADRRVQAHSTIGCTRARRHHLTGVALGEERARGRCLAEELCDVHRDGRTGPPARRTTAPRASPARAGSGNNHSTWSSASSAAARTSAGSRPTRKTPSPTYFSGCTARARRRGLPPPRTTRRRDARPRRRRRTRGARSIRPRRRAPPPWRRFAPSAFVSTF